jgi:diguanylate cyclase (GGDEF)-like protein
LADARVRTLCVAGAAWLAVYTAATGLVANSRTGQLILGDVAYHVPLVGAAACLRGDDLVARYGGEEFIVLLRLADPQDLTVVAERWRAAVSTVPVALSDGQLVLPTVSVGAAFALPGESTLDELFLHADRALYEAKAGGRNRVVLSRGVRAA